MNDRVKQVLLYNLLLAILYVAADYIMTTSLNVSLDYNGIMITNARGSAIYSFFGIALRVEGDVAGGGGWGSFGSFTPNLPFFVFLAAITVNLYLLNKSYSGRDRSPLPPPQ